MGTEELQTMLSHRSITNNAGGEAAHILSQQSFSDSFSHWTNMPSTTNKRGLKKVEGGDKLKVTLDKYICLPPPKCDHFLRIWNIKLSASPPTAEATGCLFLSICRWEKVIHSRRSAAPFNNHSKCPLCLWRYRRWSLLWLLKGCDCYLIRANTKQTLLLHSQKEKKGEKNLWIK